MISKMKRNLLKFSLVTLNSKPNMASKPLTFEELLIFIIEYLTNVKYSSDLTVNDCTGTQTAILSQYSGESQKKSNCINIIRVYNQFNYILLRNTT